MEEEEEREREREGMGCELVRRERRESLSHSLLKERDEQREREGNRH